MSTQSVGEQIFGKPDCHHNVPWGSECLECKIDWYKACREDARRRVLSCTEEIERLIRQSTAQRIASGYD